MPHDPSVVGTCLRSVFLFLLCSLLAGCLPEAPAPSIEHSTALLTSLLQDKHPDIRSTAAESLGKIGDRSVVSSVLPLLTDAVPVVRLAAAQALGRVAMASDEAVIAGLTGLLHDPEDNVRRAAAMAIGEIEPLPRDLMPIVGLLQASDGRIRSAAMAALQQVDTSHLTMLLLPALDDPDPKIRQAAVAALGLSGDPRTIPALHKRLVQDAVPGVRSEAAYQLGKVGGSTGRSVLQTALAKEPDSSVRRWLEAELRSLRGND